MALMTPEDRACFSIEVEDVNWEKYMYDFCWGLQKFVLKEDVPPWEMKSTLKVPHHFGADLQFALEGGSRGLTPVFDAPPTPESIVRNSRVQAQVAKMAEQTGRSVAQIEAEATAKYKKMRARLSMPCIRLFAYVFPKIYRCIYDEILVDKEGIDKLRHVVAKGPVIFLPTHRSYIDFLIISYVTFANRLPVPNIAAAEVFLKMGPLTGLLRGAGAFFLSRGGGMTELDRVILDIYVAALVRSSPMLEFFMEGTRSRSGKTLTPRRGMIEMVLNTVLAGQIPNAYIVPVTINYEKTLEVDAIAHELKGGAKTAESFTGAIKGGMKAMKQNFGSVKVCFGDAVSVQVSRNGTRA